MPGFNGRSCRSYASSEPSPDRYYLHVRYYRRRGSKVRQLTVTPRLMAKVLRP